MPRSRLASFSSLASLLTVATLAIAAPLSGGCSKPHAAAPSSTDGLTLPLAPRAVGMTWTKTDDTTTDLELTAGDDKVKVGGTRHHRTDNRILAVGDDGIVTKVAVTYSERVEHSVGPAPEDKPSVLAGKSYVVWVDGDAVQATTADGAAVSADELAEITADQDELGKPPVMEQLMARAWKVGARVDLTDDELARLRDGKGSAPSATAMSLTLTAVRGDDAEFALTMKLEDDARAMTIDVTGTVVVDARTGRPRRLEIAGPVSGSAGGMPVSGTMKGLVTYAFTDAAR